MQIYRICFYILLSSVGMLLLAVGLGSPLTVQIILTVLLLIGAGFEIKVARHRFLVHPPAFFMAYTLVTVMVAGIWYFATNYQETSQFIVEDATILRGTWYSMVAVQALWVGFYLLPEQRLVLFGRPDIRRIPTSLILSLVAISLVSFLLGVKLNVYGYVADPTKVDYVSYIRFGINLGLLAIVLVGIYDFDDPARRRLLHLLVIIYFLVGLLFGSKSTAIMPMVILIVALYVTGRKIPRPYFVAGVFGLMAAYAVIEPFRIYFEATRGQQQAQSIENLIRLYVAAQDVAEKGDLNYGDAFLVRMNYSLPLAKAIEFADQQSFYYKEEWDHLPLSPLYGIIPRFLWESKPLANFGLWASANIFGLEFETHTGITPQGYAYLVGRLPAVLCFFLLYGIIQRGVFNFLYLNRAYLPFFILIFFDLGYPVSPWTYVSGTLQSLILISPLLIGVGWLGRVRRQPCLV